MAVDVIDSGPGVPPHMASRIFEEFTRLEQHQDRPGAGLGLAVARRLARLLGGDVTVDQGDLGGAMFTLWLPKDVRIS
jgi:signal transduction histidine kinase